MEPTVPITITRLDAERIDALLDSREFRDAPGAAALRAELDRAEIVEPHALPAGVVAMNSTLRALDETTGRQLELTLVYPRDSDIAAGRVSVLAPAGSALLGLGVGQAIEWEVPGGPRLALRVTEVLSQPGAAGAQPR